MARVYSKLMILVNTANTGRGDLNIVISDERSQANLPVTTKKITSNEYSAQFVPELSGRYKVELEYNDSPIDG